MAKVFLTESAVLAANLLKSLGFRQVCRLGSPAARQKRATTKSADGVDLLAE
jgi:hypothetical protein